MNGKIFVVKLFKVILGKTGYNYVLWQSLFLFENLPFASKITRTYKSLCLRS